MNMTINGSLGLFGILTQVRSLDKEAHGSEGAVDVVGVDGSASAGGVASHVLVQHTQHALTGGSVVGEDGLGAEETTLLTSVEVELDCVLRPEAGSHKDAEGLEEVDGASGVVIGAGGTGSGGASGGIEVSTNDD
ncbi:hypothetical protein ColTof4_09201 [Colletotrichum tofieldiae]|nr:hypothetical protein ColTof4_09201 [Colletotrichum tofieldiae]